MEQLLHYCWKHKILPLHELRTTDGRTVEVIHPGFHNHDAGPDFLNAKVRIADVLWVGNVEIHNRTSDWHRHHHEGNPAYENVILHVAEVVDTPLHYPNGEEIPQLQLTVPQYVRDNYAKLLQADAMPRCRDVLGEVSRLTLHSWLSALQVERMELRTRQIMERGRLLSKNWEDVLFVTLARSFGFGKNGDAFERWAYSIPMGALAKHRDNLHQIEAIFFGQAGLLEQDVLPEDFYYQQLRKEYRYLRQKFSLIPMDMHHWKFLRLRPQNFPHIRIAQLAMLYFEQRLNLSKLLNATTVEEVRPMFATHVSDYWKNHYTFGTETVRVGDRQLSAASVDSLLINAVSPLLFCYGRYKDNEPIAEKGISLLEQLKPENNRIIRDWQAAGVHCQSAADTQALLQLTTAYCERRDCIRCRLGYEYIRHTPAFMAETTES